MLCLTWCAWPPDVLHIAHVDRVWDKMISTHQAQISASLRLYKFGGRHSTQVRINCRTQYVTWWLFLWKSMYGNVIILLYDHFRDTKLFVCETSELEKLDCMRVELLLGAKYQRRHVCEWFVTITLVYTKTAAPSLTPIVTIDSSKSRIWFEIIAWLAT